MNRIVYKTKDGLTSVMDSSLTSFPPRTVRPTRAAPEYLVQYDILNPWAAAPEVSRREYALQDVMRTEFVTYYIYSEV